MKPTIIVGLTLFIGLGSLNSFASLTLVCRDEAVVQNQLFDAIREGDLKSVKSLLNEKVRLSDANASGSTPLHFAVLFNHSDIVQFLITKGALVNAHNKRDGNTPLHDAVDEGNADIVQLLLDNKADVTLKNHDNNRPLQEAQKKDKGIITKLLLEAEAQLQREDAQEHKLKESVDFKKEVLSGGWRGTYKNHNNNTPLQEAGNEGMAAIEHLLKTGALLQKEDEKESKYNVPISSKKEALPTNQQDKHRGQIKADVQQKMKELESISKKVLSVTEQRIYNKWLLEAAKGGNNQEIQGLLEAGANLEAVEEDGSTPLHWAATNGHTKAVRLLIERDANIEVILVDTSKLEIKHKKLISRTTL